MNPFLLAVKERQRQSEHASKEIVSSYAAFSEKEAQKAKEKEEKLLESKLIHEAELKALKEAEESKAKLLEERIARSKEIELQKRQEAILKDIERHKEKTARWVYRNSLKDALVPLDNQISKVWNRPEILRLSMAARSLAAKESLEFLESAPPSYFRELERKVMLGL